MWQDSYLHAVMEAEAVPAVLANSEDQGNSTQWGRRSCQVAADATTAPSLSCRAPKTGSWAVALLWEWPAQSSGGRTNRVATLPAAVPGPRNAISAIFPAPGAPTNQSLLIISGTGLTGPLACELRDGAHPALLSTPMFDMQ